MLIITEHCSVFNLFYKLIIHRKFAVPEGEFFHLSIPHFLGKKRNSGLCLYLMFVSYMETLYIFLKMIEILVIIPHLHSLLTHFDITYMVKTFCLWKILSFDESFFTGQRLVRVVFFTLMINIITLDDHDDQYHHSQLRINIAVIRWPI